MQKGKFVVLANPIQSILLVEAELKKQEKLAITFHLLGRADCGVQTCSSRRPCTHSFSMADR